MKNVSTGNLQAFTSVGSVRWVSNP